MRDLDDFTKILEKEAEKDKKADPNKVEVPDLKGRGVLIVEDDAEERKRAEEAVIKAQYIPFAVMSYTQAFMALGKADFVTILSDLHYPCVVLEDNDALTEQKEPQPCGIALVIDAKKKGLRIAIVTDQYHHGSAEWASGICNTLNVPLLDIGDSSDEHKPWAKALERSLARSNYIMELKEC